MKELHENRIHRSILAYLRQTLPGAFIHHSPNECRDDIERMRKAEMGTVPGYPDLIVHLQGGQTLFLEVKSPSGRISPAQKEVMARLAALGNTCAVVRSIDEVQAVLSEMGVNSSDQAVRIPFRGAIT